jgi:hypothetical protein
MPLPTEDWLTAHGDACHGCRVALEEAVATYRETARPAIAGDHPTLPNHRGGCWAEYETRYWGTR